MWYLLTILIILVSAPAAISECLTSFSQLEVKSDCGLPDSSAAYPAEGCSEFKWSFHFTRTDKTAGRTTIFVRILGTNALEWLYSENYPPGRYHLEWAGLVFSPENQLEITLISGSCGYFEDMELEVYDYR